METIKTIRHDIQLGLNEVMHITPLGDVHADAAAHDRKKLLETLARRSSLPNAYMLSLGDLSECIGPGDHRDTASHNRDGGDAWVDEQVDREYELYKSYNWLAIGEGNHENKITRLSGTNPSRRLAERLGIPFGGYAYRLILRLFDRSANRGSRGVLRILVHHGAWGGRAAAGYTGALNWAQGYPGYDLFFYGHNHQTMHRLWDREEIQTSGRIYKSPQGVVACGTFLQPSIKSDTTYSLKAGYGPVFIGCPLITVQLKRNKVGIEIANGNIR